MTSVQALATARGRRHAPRGSAGSEGLGLTVGERLWGLSWLASLALIPPAAFCRDLSSTQHFPFKQESSLSFQTDHRKNCLDASN